MPLYGFTCTRCQHAFDKLMRLNDPKPSKCPACQTASLTQDVTAPTVRLAGTGWYETDFKRASERRHVATPDSAPPARPCKP